MKKGFTLIELLVVISILGILSTIGLSSFTAAQAKVRDAKRKAYLSQVAASLEAYNSDHKKYPDSDISGQIKACGAGFNTACTWSADSLKDANGTTYMVKLPADPSTDRSFFYASLDSGKKFQLYSRLENTQDLQIKTLTSPNCGTQLCNWGVASSNIAWEEGRL